MRLITSNGFLFIFFVLFFLTLTFTIIKFNNKLLNNYNLYFFINFLFDFLKNLIQQNISSSYNDQKYNQYLLLIFFLILFSNLFGMVPYTFTITSHLLFTFSLSLSIFIGINIIGIRKLKLEFFQLFFPSGVPLIMGPFLIVIELISYLSRVFSLAIRLFANIMSGHTLLKILSSFV
jgi:F-type H+-transporting ATPase subunit a